jgi:hypothetical protein
MPLAIVRGDRIGLQLFGGESDPHTARIVDDTFEECYAHEIFAYPIYNVTFCPSFDSLRNGHIPNYSGRFTLPTTPYLTIDTDKKVRIITYFRNPEINNSEFSWIMTDISRQHKKGYVFGEVEADRDSLIGIIESGASEEVISEQVRLLRIGSFKPIVWFNIDDIVTDLKNRSLQPHPTLQFDGVVVVGNSF